MRESSGIATWAVTCASSPVVCAGAVTTSAPSGVGLQATLWHWLHPAGDTSTVRARSMTDADTRATIAMIKRVREVDGSTAEVTNERTLSVALVGASDPNWCEAFTTVARLFATASHNERERSAARCGR